MSVYNECFHTEMKKILIVFLVGKSVLSGAYIEG